MATSANFTAYQSDKYLRITDNFPKKPKPKPEKSKKLIGGDKNSIFRFKFESYEGTTGRVKVEVSRDGKTFGVHDKDMQVVHEGSYSIDDSKLPKSKGSGTSGSPLEHSSTIGEER